MDLRRSEESRITYMKCMKLMTSRNSSFLYLGFLKKNLLSSLLFKEKLYSNTFRSNFRKYFNFYNIGKIKKLNIKNNKNTF